MPVLIFTSCHWDTGQLPLGLLLRWHPLPHLLAYRQWVKVVALLGTVLIAAAVHRCSRWVAGVAVETRAAAYWGKTSGVDDDNFWLQLDESIESCLSRMQHVANCKVDVFCCQLHSFSRTVSLPEYQQCLEKGEIIIQSKQTISFCLSCRHWKRGKKSRTRFWWKLGLRWDDAARAHTERAKWHTVELKDKENGLLAAMRITLNCTQGQLYSFLLTTWLRQRQFSEKILLNVSADN